MKLPTEALALNPGDTLVVRYEQRLTAAEADQIKQRLGADLPGVKVVILVADQMAKLTAESMEDAVRLAQENPGRVVRLDA